MNWLAFLASLVAFFAVYIIGRRKVKSLVEELTVAVIGVIVSQIVFKLVSGA